MYVSRLNKDCTYTKDSRSLSLSSSILFIYIYHPPPSSYMYDKFSTELYCKKYDVLCLVRHHNIIYKISDNHPNPRHTKPITRFSYKKYFELYLPQSNKIFHQYQHILIFIMFFYYIVCLGHNIPFIP